MTEELAKVMPLFIASTLSPGIFALAIYLIGEKKGASRLVMFFLGSLVVALIIGIVGLYFSSSLNSTPSNNDNYLADLIFGIVFIIFGITNYFHHDGKQHFSNNKQNTWWKWLTLGIVVSATNFDALLLNFTAVKEIGDATNIDQAEKIILIIVGILFFTAPILIPVIFKIIAPNTSQTILEPANNFIKKNSNLIVAIIFISFGIYLLSKGIKIFY